MCLAVPGRVVAVAEFDGLRMGRVDFGGVTKEVCLAYLPDVAVGEYVVIHAGFAISRLDEATAWDTLQTFRELDGRGPGP